MIVVPDGWNAKLLGRLAAGLVYLPFTAGTTVFLYQNDLVPTRAMVIGDFVECDFTGYASVTSVAVFQGPFSGGLTGPYLQGALSYFTAGAPFTTPNAVYGYYVTDALGDLVMAERFDAVVNMTVAAQNISIAPTIGFVSQDA